MLSQEPQLPQQQRQQQFVEESRKCTLIKLGVPEGVKYLEDLEELKNYAAPRFILDKRRCGCGATEWKLKSAEHVVIAVPYVAIIKSKQQQHGESICGVYFSTTTTTTSSSARVCATEAEDGPAPCDREELIEQYVLQRLERREYLKIMATYDSLPKVVAVLRRLLQSNNNNNCACSLVVDEYHNLFTAYAYRKEAINGVLAEIDSAFYKSVCLISGTSLREEFMPEKLLGWPCVQLEWADQGQQQATLYPIQTDKIQYQVIKLIKEKLAGKIIGNLHFFCNSATFIARLLKKMKQQEAELSDLEVKVVCAHTQENQNKLTRKYKISSNFQEAKQINFYTATAFEGADIYDSEGITYIVSDKYLQTTMLDISTQAMQIAGRIRNSKYAHIIRHIYNLHSPKCAWRQCLSLAEFRHKTAEKIALAKERVLDYNKLGDSIREDTLKLLIKSGQLDEQYIQLNAQSGLVEYDANLAKLALLNFEIMHEIYKSPAALKEAYEKDSHGRIRVAETEVVASAVSALKASDRIAAAEKGSKRIKFEVLFKEYAQLYYQQQQQAEQSCADRVRMQCLCEHNPLVEEARRKLGCKKVEKLKYVVANIRAAIKFRDAAGSCKSQKMLRMIRDAFQEGREYTNVAVKARLATIYNASDYHVTAKATDIKKWFDIVPDVQIRQPAAAAAGKFPHGIRIICAKDQFISKEKKN